MWLDHRALTIIVGTALLLLVVFLLWLFYLNKQLDDIRRFPLDVDDRPARVPGDAVNILLLGADDPDGQGGLFEQLDSGEWEPGSFRSDAIMVLHLNADRSSAQLVSIPRDSYVPIEGHGRNKINAAFSFGGPSLMVDTVERLTNLYIDHTIVIDFSHFVEMTETIGGVDVTIPHPINDRGRVWEAGPHHLEGEDALWYVRTRYGLPRGDFDRVQRHQNFLRAVLDKMVSTSVLANPFRVTRLATDLSDLVAVDESLTSGRLRSLVLGSRGLRPSTMRFVTAPYVGTGMVGEASVVNLDVPMVRSMFRAVAIDQFEVWYGDNQVEELPAADDVS